MGGTTRVPAIRQTVQEFFPDLELCTSLNPMSSVALGLAIQAALRSKIVPLHELRSALMLDCIPHAIGAELSNGHFVEIIPRNTLLPARGSATFCLADKHQAGVTIRPVELVGQDQHGNAKYEPMANEDFTFLLRRLPSKELEQISERSIEIGMKVDTQGQFIVSIFDEKDPEQVRKKERYENRTSEAVVGELGYITDLVWAESDATTEQFLLTGMLVGVLIVYIAVKLAFSEPGDGGPII